MSRREYSVGLALWDDGWALAYRFMYIYRKLEFGCEI